jgi:hypothetical protein
VPEPTNKPFRRLSRLLLKTVAICLVTTASAQGTIQFGFENFSVGVTPPFVRQDLPNEAAPRVDDAIGTLEVMPPFEGQRYLAASGAISIASPDGQLIQAYSFRLYVPSASRGSQGVVFTAAGKQMTVQEFDSWQLVQGAFPSPVATLSMAAFRPPEFSPAIYGIDSVEFSTIPEPKTFWLLTIGVAAIASRPLLKRPKPTCA